ncbi:MAG: hypothetical protein K1X88_13715 [Nannocystaceae bacterium]|nr:hypothetical protein [Nannocystaceae bacterium]
MTNRLRHASIVAALLCACDDGEDTNATTVGTTIASTTATTTMTGGGGDTGDDGDGDDGDDGTTGDDGDDSGGSDPTDATADPTQATTDPSGGSSDDGGGESTGADTGFSISGMTARAAAGAISPGDDGVGTLYVGLLAQCDVNGMPAGGTSVLGANLSQVGSTVPWTIEGLAPGTYYVAGFLDDDVNADPNSPYADMGDLAFAEGFGVGCVEVQITNADVGGVYFELNINVPF